MKLLVDEDSQSRGLIALLRNADHTVLTATEAGLESLPDQQVLESAITARCVLLTQNGVDFLRLHKQSANHYGILVINHDRNPAKDMGFDDILRAIANLEASGWDIAGQFVSLNDWQFGRG